MIVSAHQPSYYPWLGWIHKVINSDKFILMDEVQLADRAFQHRNIFLTKEGGTKYLSIPFQKKGYRDLKIRELKLNENINWQKENLDFIEVNYKKHLFFDEVYDEVKVLYSKKYQTVFEVLHETTLLVFSMLEIKTELILQSSLDYKRDVTKGDLILEMIKAVGANCYLSGIGAKAYMDESLFEKEGIKIVYQEFDHPIYSQKNSKEFVSGLNCLDLLFNLGIEGSRNFIKQIKDEA